MTHGAAETSTLDDAHQAIFDAGLVVRKEVLGDEYVDAALAKNAGSDGKGCRSTLVSTCGARCGPGRGWIAVAAAC